MTEHQGTLIHIDGKPLLIQLDMYLAAGQLIPVDPKPWVDAYAELMR